jgi:hypothetical protein
MPKYKYHRNVMPHFESYSNLNANPQFYVKSIGTEHTPVPIFIFFFFFIHRTANLQLIVISPYQFPRDFDMEGFGFWTE